MGKNTPGPEIGSAEVVNNPPNNFGEIVVTHKHNTLSKLKNTTLAGLAAISLIAGHKVYSDISNAVPSFSDIDIPDINVAVPDNMFITETGPSIVVAGVDHESYEIERSFEITCYQQVSVQVGVTGKKDGAEFLNFDISDAKLDKKVFGDILLCSNDSANATLTETVDPITQEITRVDVQLAPLEVVHPRVDHGDERNCADINADDPIEVVEEKIREYEESILPENLSSLDEKVPCDNGVSLTRFHLIGLDVTELTTSGYQAAQLAMLIDAGPRELITQLNKDRVEKIKLELEDNEAYANAQINVEVNQADLRSGLDIEEQFNQAAENESLNFRSVTYENTENDSTIMHVITHSGDEISIQMGFDSAITQNQFAIKGDN